MKIKNVDKRGALFDKVQVRTPNRSAFDLSFENKLSLNMGKLTPILCKEVLPGDKFTIDASAFVRLQPLVAPIMHKVDVYVHYFFVPNRLIWSNWEKFISPANGEEVMSAMDVYTPPVPPAVPNNMIGFSLDNIVSDGYFDRSNIFSPSSLADYLGVNAYFQRDGGHRDIPKIESFNAERAFISDLPFRAYHLICDEYFRNEALEEPVFTEEWKNTDGYTTNPTHGKLSNYSNLRNRSWAKDYFTSCLPSPQQGKSVILEGGDVNLSQDKFTLWTEQYTSAPTQVFVSKSPEGSLTSGETPVTKGYLNSDGTVGTYSDNNAQQFLIKRRNSDTGEMEDFVLPSTAISINALRRASKIQEFLELQGRAGSRYAESIRSHWGVTPSDARLQRPEYLGGGKQAVTISAVEQTTPTDNSPLGNYAGRGVSASSEFSCQYGEAEEHGFVIGIMSIMPTTAYQQGINKMFTRRDTLDYAFPLFANLGEQEVKVKEVWFDPSEAEDAEGGSNNDTFGYIPRYAEYKYNFDEVHGDFKTTLDYWHLGRIFTAEPRLNVSFVKCEPSYRVFAVETDKEGNEIDHFLTDIWFDFKIIRALPKFGTPQLS